MNLRGWAFGFRARIYLNKFIFHGDVRKTEMKKSETSISVKTIKEESKSTNYPMKRSTHQPVTLVLQRQKV